MTVNHRIRLAVRGLKGATREAAILRCLTSTSTMKRLRHRGKATVSQLNLALSVRVSPEEYLTLRNRAKSEYTSISALIRRRLFG